MENSGEIKLWKYLLILFLFQLCETFNYIFFGQEMGFTRQQAEAAIKRYGTVQAALDSLLAGVGKSGNYHSEQ